MEAPDTEDAPPKKPTAPGKAGGKPKGKVVGRKIRKFTRHVFGAIGKMACGSGRMISGIGNGGA
eukprot:1245262-Alexandrium_andersonii.AAC.1